jgi:hypothetical protein
MWGGVAELAHASQAFLAGLREGHCLVKVWVCRAQHGWLSSSGSQNT